MARAIIRSIISAFRMTTAPQRRPDDAPTVPAGGELRKDPVCGTYVSIVGSPSRTVRGELVYFCSAECRDKYRVA